MWCIPPEQDAAFVARMERVLDVHSRPFDARFPVVCMDEQPCQLLSETRPPLPTKPGTEEIVDHEYFRESLSLPSCRRRNVWPADPESGKQSGAPDAVPTTELLQARGAMRRCWRWWAWVTPAMWANVSVPLTTVGAGTVGSR